MNLEIIKNNALEKSKGKGFKTALFSYYNYIVILGCLFLIAKLEDYGVPTPIPQIAFIALSIPFAYASNTALYKYFKTGKMNLLWIFIDTFKYFIKSWISTVIILIKLILPIAAMIAVFYFFKTQIVTLLFKFYITLLSLKIFNFFLSLTFLEIIAILLIITIMIWSASILYYYRQIPALIVDEEKINTFQIIKNSKKIMINKRMNLFSLDLSFALKVFLIEIAYILLNIFIIKAMGPNNSLSSIGQLIILTYILFYIFPWQIFAKFEFYVQAIQLDNNDSKKEILSNETITLYANQSNNQEVTTNLNNQTDSTNTTQEIISDNFFTSNTQSNNQEVTTNLNNQTDSTNTTQEIIPDDFFINK